MSVNASPSYKPSFGTYVRLGRRRWVEGGMAAFGHHMVQRTLIDRAVVAWYLDRRHIITKLIWQFHVVAAERVSKRPSIFALPRTRYHLRKDLAACDTRL
jgi:hypothetical protein